MPTSPYPTRRRQVIGIIPASGRATRLPGSPCSKEILPVGMLPGHGDRPARLKTACEYLLQSMSSGGIHRIFLVIRADKCDIPRHLANSEIATGAALTYLVNDGTAGAPWTIDQVYPHIDDSLTALGFPDIIFHDNQSFNSIIDHLEQVHADVVLGLFPADQPAHCDLVEVDEHGRVRKLFIKASGVDLPLTWGIAVWTPAFTRFLHHFLTDHPQQRLRSRASDARTALSRELHLGDVIQAAIDQGLQVSALQVANEPYIDIGRPENYFRAMQRFASAHPARD